MDAALPRLFYLSESNLLSAGAVNGGTGNGERWVLIWRATYRGARLTVVDGHPITLNWEFPSRSLTLLAERPFSGSAKEKGNSRLLTFVMDDRIAILSIFLLGNPSFLKIIRRGQTRTT
jgi:hypothetical protein